MIPVLKYGGVVSRVEPETSGRTRVIFMTCGRIAKFSTYGAKWLAYSPQAYAAFMSRPENIQARVWREIEQENMEDERAAANYNIPPHHMLLFLLTIHQEVVMNGDDEYSRHVVRSMVVAAYTPQCAKDFALSYEHLDHSSLAWEDSRNILCKTIGVAFGFGTQRTIVSVSREDTNG